MTSLRPTRSTPPSCVAAEPRARRLARDVGFVGRVAYRHVVTQSGGAQYGRGAGDRGAVLMVYAEAFDRDADPEDFSLRAIIAHEPGHQLLARHPRLSPRLAGVSPAAEEVLASLLGAMMVGEGPDRDALMAKATAEVLAGGDSPGAAVRLVAKPWDELGSLLS
jgi:hypothetical protein